MSNTRLETLLCNRGGGIAGQGSFGLLQPDICEGNILHYHDKDKHEQSLLCV